MPPSYSPVASFSKERTNGLAPFISKENDIYRSLCSLKKYESLSSVE
jgi:hypothetical protein